MILTRKSNEIVWKLLQISKPDLVFKFCRFDFATFLSTKTNSIATLFFGSDSNLGHEKLEFSAVYSAPLELSQYCTIAKVSQYLFQCLLWSTSDIFGAVAIHKIRTKFSASKGFFLWFGWPPLVIRYILAYPPYIFVIRYIESCCDVTEEVLSAFGADVILHARR